MTQGAVDILSRDGTVVLQWWDIRTDRLVVGGLIEPVEPGVVCERVRIGARRAYTTGASIARRVEHGVRLMRCCEGVTLQDVRYAERVVDQHDATGRKGQLRDLVAQRLAGGAEATSIGSEK
jgi:hypothetical protein